MLEEIKKELTKLRQVLGKVAYYSRGAYDSSFLYKKHDVVTYQGSSYVSLKETQGNLPTNEEYWMLLAKKGDKGDQGDQGIQGEKGIQGDTGPQGERGLQGIQGEVGPMGPQGPKGEKGDKGDKGDTYEVTENDLQTIATQITENANSEFNQHVEEKTNEFNMNVTNKTNSFDTNAANKIEEFNTNAETKTTDYNSNASDKLAEYNDNATVKVEEFNSNADSLRKDIGDNTSRIKRLETNLDIGEVTGESINVKDSAYSESIEIESAGGFERETTTGKNILDCSKIETGTLNGITCSYDKATQIITLDGECTTDNTVFLFNIGNYNVEKNKTTLTIYHQGGTTSGLGSVRSFDSNYGSEMVLRFVDTLSNPVLSKTSAENYEAKWTNLRFNNGDTASNLKIKIMLAHDTDTTYEPFTNGPSPNPDYKQDIEVIESGNYEVTICNKNLFDKSKTVTRGRRMSVATGDTYATEETTNYSCATFTQIIENKKYTLNTHYTVYICWYDKNKKYISGLLKNTNIQSITSPKNACFIRFDYLTAEEDSVQLELREFSTTYEPHQESKLLVTIPEGEFAAKLSDEVTDKIVAKYNEEDKHYHLYLEKNIGRDYFKNVSWRMPASNDTNVVFTNVTGTDIYQKRYSKDSVEQLNNFFIWNGRKAGFKDALNTGPGMYTYTYISEETTYQYVYFVVSKTFANSLEKWLDFLINNEIVSYYPLAEPYVVPLGIVDMPLTYPNETNMFNNFPLPVEMKLSYYRNPHLTIEQLQSRIEELENNSVKNTDYATLANAGIVKANYNYATNSDNSGNLLAGIRSLDGYNSLSDNAFISKGTLENVLAPIRNQLNQAMTTTINEEVIENDIPSE